MAAPTYILEDVVLSNAKIIGLRTSISIEPTSADIGKYCVVVIPLAEIARGENYGKIVKQRLVSGVWTDINGAGFQGGPSRLDLNGDPYYVGLEIDASDVGKMIRFTWEAGESFTAKLQVAQIINNDDE